MPSRPFVLEVNFFLNFIVFKFDFAFYTFYKNTINYLFNYFDCNKPIDVVSFF